MNAPVQYANTGHVEFWGAHGVAAAFGVGLVAGAVTCGVGGLVGGAVGGGIAGALAGGAAGGVAGGAAGYMAGVAFGGDFSAKGFGLAMLGGGITGAIGGVSGGVVGDLLNSGFAAAVTGGAAGGTAGWVFGGVVSHDWSATSFALSVGVSMASAVASYGVTSSRPKTEHAFDQLPRYQEQKAAGNFDLSDIPVHSKDLGSLPGYTTNNDINIDADQWNGNMNAGHEDANLDLLTHEATHSLQYSLMPLGLAQFGARYVFEITKPDSYNYNPYAQPPLAQTPLQNLDVLDHRSTLDGIAEWVKMSRPGYTQ